MTEHVTSKHYRRIAERYTDYLSYSEDFVPTLAAKMVELLRLDTDDVLVDLGGGTGLYTAAILDQLPMRRRVILVDYFAEMLDRVPDDLPVERIHLDALAFSEADLSYDKVLIKETIHHIDDSAPLLTNLYDRLTPGGAILLVHVPPELDYPLFDAALERARTWHADPDELMEQLAAAGFRTARDAVDWQHSLSKQHYFEMVTNRYMSVLSSFTDDELHDGLLEMKETYADTDVLEFTDHFDFLAGYKD